MVECHIVSVWPSEAKCTSMSKTKKRFQSETDIDIVKYAYSHTAYAPEAVAPAIFTCVSYAEARNRYRLDVCPSVRPSVRHTLVLYKNGSTYRHDFFTAQ